MPYRNIVSQVMQHTTDAEFRAWGVIFTAQLAAMGWVQAVDTGQINWGTVTRPAGANTVQGYEIWKFGDTLQATAPVFIKIEYGSGAGASSFGTWLQVGKATNGAGAFVGLASTRQQVAVPTASANAMNCVFSGYTDYGLVWLGYSGTGSSGSTQAMWSIEREVDANGARVGTGVLITTTTNGLNANTWKQEYYNFTAGAGGQESDLGIMVPKLGNGTSGADIASYPQHHASGVFLPFGLNQLAYFTSAIAAGTIVSFQLYGATHTYLTIGSGFAGSTGMNRGDIAGTHLMVRYEN